MRQDLFPNMGKNWKARVHSILRKHTLFPLQGTGRGTLNMQHPPLPSPAEMWHETHQVRNSKESWQSLLNWFPQHTETQNSLNSSRISLSPSRTPVKDFPLPARHGKGEQVAVVGPESYEFCGIMLISGPRWECARSQRAALNLPKMEQISTALLFNDGNAAWRLQIPASNAPKRDPGAGVPWLPGGQGQPHFGLSEWDSYYCSFCFFFYYYIPDSQKFCSRKCLISYHLGGKGGLFYFYS